MSLTARQRYQLDHAPTIAAGLLSSESFVAAGGDNSFLDAALTSMIVTGIIFDEITDPFGASGDDGRAHVQDGPDQGMAKAGA